MDTPELINQTLPKVTKRLNDEKCSTRSERKLATSIKCHEIKCAYCNNPIPDNFQWNHYTYPMCQDCINLKLSKQKENKINQLINREIPEKYKTIESDKKKTLETSQGKSLFIHGTSGTGKTVLACSLAKNHIKQGLDAKFINFPAFIMELQCSYRKNEENPFEIAREIANFHGLLVIDDLGAEKLTDYVKQIIYFIVNEREQKCLLTVITSNFTLGELDRHIDSRISSRISGMCEIVKLTGMDRRLKK